MTVTPKQYFSGGIVIHDGLRLVRVFHNKNQVQMAEMLGVSKSYLSEIESGKKTPTLSLLSKYSEALSIPISSIMFFAENIDHKDTVKTKVTGKVVKMLDWVATISK